MIRNNHRVTLTTRSLALMAFLALAGAVQADLKMNVDVSASVDAVHGIPKSGIYEVDFKGSMARIVQPDGSVRIFDFGGSQVARLDSKAKTYYVESLASRLGSPNEPALTANISLDHSAPSTAMFGTAAQKVTIASQSPGTGSGAATKNPASGPLPPVSGQGTGGPPPNAQTPYSQGTPVSQAASTASAKPSPSITGTAWLADGSAVASSVSSVAPLVLIGAPRSLVQSITKVLNQDAVIPLSFTFSWSNGTKTPATLDMTVGAIDASTLEASTFAIPADYKLVEKPAQKK